MLTLNDYKKYTAIVRNKIANTCINDSHLHARAFGGESLDFLTTINFLKKNGVLMCIIKGIGQKLEPKSRCNYYLDCPHTTVKPSIINDIINGSNYYKYFDNFTNDIIVILSMSFVDLHKPEHIPSTIKLLDYEFPNLFKCVGEVNLCKQALHGNNITPVPKKTIPKWAEFMKILVQKDIPISIHCDIGNNKNNLKYIDLFEYVCDLYPNNKIIWCHMGMSKQLTNMPANKHIKLLETFLNKYPLLYIDISWRVLYDNIFKYDKNINVYVNFMNKYYNRILPGTDFVGSIDKNYRVYKEELKYTSYILQFLNNNAFRHIALGGNFINLFKIPNISVPDLIDKKHTSKKIRKIKKYTNKKKHRTTRKNQAETVTRIGERIHVG